MDPCPDHARAVGEALHQVVVALAQFAVDPEPDEVATHAALQDGHVGLGGAAALQVQRLDAGQKARRHRDGTTTAAGVGGEGRRRGSHPEEDRRRIVDVGGAAARRHELQVRKLTFEGRALAEGVRPVGPGQEGLVVTHSFVDAVVVGVAAVVLVVDFVGVRPRSSEIHRQYYDERHHEQEQLHRRVVELLLVAAAEKLNLFICLSLAPETWRGVGEETKCCRIGDLAKRNCTTVLR